MATSRICRRKLLKLVGRTAGVALLGRAAAGGAFDALAAEPDAEPDGLRRGRPIPQFKMPCVQCEGTALECGRMLGCKWATALRVEAERSKGSRPWWKSRRGTALIQKYAPHLPAAKIVAVLPRAFRPLSSECPPDTSS